MSRSLVSFRLADDLKLALKEKAGAEGISTTELVNRLQRQGLSCDKVGFSVEGRLSELENTIQDMLKRFEFDRLKRETLSHPNYSLDKRLMDVEGKLKKISVDEEDRCRRIETLVREISNATREDQDAHQGVGAGDSVEVSLEDLCSLLRPTSQLTEIE